MAKTFKDWLYSTEFYDGELYIDEIESEFSFVWDGDYRFTEEGERVYDPILSGTVEEKDGYLEVASNYADEILIDCFHHLIAGYVSDSYYNEMIYEVEKC